MGFDIYGLNPIANTETPAVLKKFQDGDGWIDWDKMTSDDRKDYADAQDWHNDNNPGEYFRANVWFWRPIWTFVCGSCDDFMSDSDLDAGNSNSGDRICKTKANRIASRLRKLDKKGTIQVWEDEMMVHFNEATENNEKVRKELNVFQDKMNIKYGANTPPKDYNKADHQTWSDIYAKENWAGSYPPSRDEIMRFARFCGQSGGFEIC